MWCNTLLQCVVWWIASGADDEQYKGKNGLARGVLELVWYVLLGPGSFSLSFSSISFFSLDPSFGPRGLVLFIEALVLFPKNEREGRQQLAILKGNI